jgi:hypothetical protein
MDLSTFLIVTIISVILISIGFMIPEVKYKIAYFMIICLLGLSILNIYLSVVYYIQLRNDTGVAGQQGPKGPKGAKGAPGKCSYAKECGIKDGRKIILDIAEQMYPDIPRGCLDNPSLRTCNNDQNTLEEAMPVHDQIGMLEKIAYSTTMSEDDFKKKLNVCLQDSKQCLDPTDF